MAEIKNILAATDLSDSSSQAIDRGFLLARVSGARFTIIHAVGIDALAPLRELLGENADDVSQKILDEASERLAEFVADSPIKDGIPVNMHIERGLVGTL
ncbi:universal stress protein [Nitrosomonas communis]|uniref:universal stress protein n=1 Tax=Nitrosomonas communis TaxID=44574 RepID=UPI003D2B72C3